MRLTSGAWGSDTPSLSLVCSPDLCASLAKKRMKEPPLQPMDFMAELSATPVNPVDSEIDN